MDLSIGMRARMTFKGIQLAGFCPFMVFFFKNIRENPCRPCHPRIALGLLHESVRWLVKSFTLEMEKLKNG
jgi:hypothetical protein